MLTDSMLLRLITVARDNGADAQQLSWMFGQLKNGGEPAAEVVVKIGQIISGKETKEKNLVEDVRQWVLLQDGYMNVTDCYKNLCITSPKDQTNIRVIFHRLCKDGIIAKHGDRSGCYIKLQYDVELLNYKRANMQPFDIVLPLGLNEKTVIFPHSIIVIAGVTGHGKTALALNIIRDNQDKHETVYLGSEASEQSLFTQLSFFQTPIDGWNFKAYSKTKDFHTQVVPNGLTIVDYLTDYEGFFNMPVHIDRIYEKLKRGVVVICLQKKTGATWGRSGELGAERARLYLGLEFQKLTVVKNSFRQFDKFKGLDTIQYDLKAGNAVPTSGWFDETPDTGKKGKAPAFRDPDFPREE